MEITRELREELKALSKEIFGVSSKWHTMLEKGTVQLVTRRVKETVPGKEGEEPTVTEKDVPVLTASGATQSIEKRYTVKEIHNILLSLKAQIEAHKAEEKRQQDEKAAQEAEHKALKHVHESAHGSAV